LIVGADEVQVVMEGLRQAADQVERPAELGPLEITVAPPGRLRPGLVEQYAALGVHRLVTFPNPKDISVEETVTNARGAVDAAGVVATGGPP
jgi:hypothetical protein